jgi:hypothetical protein
MDKQLIMLSTLIRILLKYFFRSFIDDAANGDWSTFGNKLKDVSGKMFVFVGAWVIGLVVAILIWPFLLCCCICPWACPCCGKKK